MAKPKTISVSPYSVLLQYQRRWVDDESRFKIGCMARQTGKSFSTSFETVRDCLRRKTTWVCLSRGERQALEWMAKAKDHSAAFHVALADYQEERENSDALMRSAEISWPNGSRLIALPSNPDTARGYSANLVLDEFAMHDKPDEIWRAIFPSISNPLRGEYKLRIVSTPNGMANRFADIWTKGERWSRHKVTIHDAKDQGLGVNIEELKEMMDDPEGWAQEYECEFIDASSVLLHYDLIATCEKPTASKSVPIEFWTQGNSTLVCGIDFARSRDMTVCWTLEKVGDVWNTVEVLELSGMNSVLQFEILKLRLSRARRCCHDYTASGIGIGDQMVLQFGEWKPSDHRFGRVELVKFGNTNKLEMFGAVRIAFENGAVHIPSSREIREDLHSMQRVTMDKGGVTYRAPHLKGSHADRFTALALALRAAKIESNSSFDAGRIFYGQNLGQSFTYQPLTL